MAQVTAETENNPELEKIYNSFANDLVSLTINEIFDAVSSRTDKIKEQYLQIDEKLDDINKLVTDETKNLEKMKRCQEYFEKLLQVKKDLANINSRFTNLKKRAIKLTDNRKQQATNLIHLKQKQLEDEEKICAKFVPPSSQDNAENHPKKNKVKTRIKTHEPDEIIEDETQIDDKNSNQEKNSESSSSIANNKENTNESEA